MSSLHSFVSSKPPLRRCMVLNIEVDMFLQVLRSMDGERRIQCQGLPSDARCVGITTDVLWNTVQLMLESATFEEVGEGYVAPELHLDFTLWAGNASPSHPNGSIGTLADLWQNA